MDRALLALRSTVGGGGKLSFGKAAYAIVLDDIGHAHPASHGIGELAQSNRGRVAITRDAEIDQLAIGQIGACEHRRHTSMHGVETM